MARGAIIGKFKSARRSEGGTLPCANVDCNDNINGTCTYLDVGEHYRCLVYKAWDDGVNKAKPVSGTRRVSSSACKFN